MWRACATSSVSSTKTSRAAGRVSEACGRAQLLGQGAFLGLPHGAPCPVPEGKLQLRRVIEALSGAPFDVSFISFEDIGKQPISSTSLDVLIAWATVIPPIPAAAGGKTHRSLPPFAALCCREADSSVWASPADISIRDIISAGLCGWGWKRKRASLWGTANSTNKKHPITSCWRMQRARQLRRGQEGCVCAGGYAGAHQA